VRSANLIFKLALVSVLMAPGRGARGPDSSRPRLDLLLNFYTNSGGSNVFVNPSGIRAGVSHELWSRPFTFIKSP